MLAITGGRLLLPDRELAEGQVECDGPRIAYAGPRRPTPSGTEIIDAAGGIVAPGLIDLHIHGYRAFGVNGEVGHLQSLSDALPAIGVTAFCATSMCHVEPLERIAAHIGELNGGACCLGLYVEGPFVSPAKSGGIQPECIWPWDRHRLTRLFDALNHRVALMTVAPEIDGGLDAVEAICAEGAVASLGHSLASSAEARQGVSAGARNVTHLFNAMSGIDHKRPGLAAAGLLDDSVYVELNADGTHVHPETLRLVSRVKPPERIILISDAVVGAGEAVGGRIDYFGHPAEVAERGVYYTESGTLIGSRYALPEAIRNYCDVAGTPLYAAVAMASRNPAALLGEGERIGALAPGLRADIAIFDAGFRQAQHTVIGGRSVWRRHSP